MNLVVELTCARCAHSNGVPEIPAPTCSQCGGVLEVHFDRARAAQTLTAAALAERPRDIWRYRELLPLPLEPDSARPPQPVGWTPLVDAPRLSAWCGTRRLTLKDDGRNPSASFKDRASAIGAAHAASLGYDTVACASTGNAASSLACMAAGMGLRPVIFIPERAPEPKVTQLLAFGATVLKVRGGYAAAYDLCTAACERFGWYNRNAALNPWVIEGKKTGGMEIAEQTAADPPDWVVVSVGDGCTIAGVIKGMEAMVALGLAPRMPRVLGVQASGARPIADAFEAGLRQVTPVAGGTLADSIDVGHPRNDTKALDALRRVNGAVIAVSDEAIVEALRETPKRSGVFGEPAAVASVAGLRAAVAAGIVPGESSVLVLVTGNGLKDVSTAAEAVGKASVIDAELEAVAMEVGV